jgi:hypothetical protein
MPGDDLVQLQVPPQPARQPHIAEAARVGPTDLAQTDAHGVGIVGERHVIVVGKQCELSGLPLAIVKNDRALPAVLLKVVEFAQVSDDALPASRVGARAFDQRVVRQFFSRHSPCVAPEKHAGLLATTMAGVSAIINSLCFHYMPAELFPLPKTRGFRAIGPGKTGKITHFFSEVRKIG